MATSMDDANRMVQGDLAESITEQFLKSESVIGRLGGMLDPWKRRHVLRRRRFLWWRWTKVIYTESEAAYAERLVKLGPRPKTVSYRVID